MVGVVLTEAASATICDSHCRFMSEEGSSAALLPLPFQGPLPSTVPLVLLPSSEQELLQAHGRTVLRESERERNNSLSPPVSAVLGWKRKRRQTSTFTTAQTARKPMASPHVSTSAHVEHQGHGPVALVPGTPPAQRIALWFTLALRGSHVDSTIPKALPGSHLAPIVARLAHVQCGLGARMMKVVSKASSSAKPHMCVAL